MAGMPTNVATMTHATGSHFVYGGVLYEATADIAIGDPIVTTGTGANASQVPGGAMGEVADLKSALNNTTGTTICDFSSGYINTSTSPINKDNVVSSTITYHTIIPCVEGDKFTIRGYTASGAAARVFAFINASGSRLTPFAASGVEYDNYTVIAPANSAYIIVQSLLSFNPYCYKGELVKNRITKIENSLTDSLVPYSVSNGFMSKNGYLITSIGTGKLSKYLVPSGASKIYLSGTSNMDVVTDNWCVLWFVANNAMMENGYVAVTQKPQTWTNYAIDIPSGTEEIWAYTPMIIKPSLEMSSNIAQRIVALENRESDGNVGFFEGAFTWTKRVFGLRMLADAQGCYFIPFNALGQGVSRGNGTDGNDYYIDNIHPTQLGAYNLGLGVWSYLRHIPCWYESVPGTAAQPLDGTQWSGKSWYAYGTSLTAGTTSTNKYADFVANMSGLVLTNKGYGGGALVSNRQIYDRLLDMTDGKLDADLITIEVGANDFGALGNPWSLDTNEFYGALNHCIHEMFAAGVKAQIVIMASYPSRYAAGDSTNKYDVDRLLNT